MNHAIRQLRSEARQLTRGEVPNAIRYPITRVARYDAITCDAAAPAVTGTPRADKKTKAARLDGGYLLKTDRPDLGDEEIWRSERVGVIGMTTLRRRMRSRIWLRINDLDPTNTFRTPQNRRRSISPTRS